MLHRQRAALAMLRDLAEIPPDQLDRDPWAFNCENGTIDLRTGELHAHNPKDFITKCCPVAYDATAAAPTFEAFVLEIMSGDAARAAFLQRWYGYCCSGDVREQKLVCHIGQGGNGKGTLRDCVEDVLGPYAGTAAPGLLLVARGSERHPTEIADLKGRRLVTCTETDDGKEMCEAFVKQATGGDRLKGRWMRADFFEFAPTHKLQLLTNYKPVIKGADYAIWRRILLVSYNERYCTPEELPRGMVGHKRDNTLPGKLRNERAGIFRWLVQGAVEWHRDGLREPDTILDDVARYQAEQDRMAQFVVERCEIDARAWAPWGGSGSDALYQAYRSWCKESGYYPFAKSRFSEELLRAVPTARRKAKFGKGHHAKHGTAGVQGLKLRADEPTI
jgi:putative DNA primase/helicase